MDGNERKKVFIVDDTSFFLVKIKQILKDYYAVFTLNSSAKMFTLLENITPDLIILDINMPDEDGFETIEKLKADESYAGIPVVFVTGRSDDESIVKGLGLGAVDFLIKPYNPKDLIHCTNTHLFPVKDMGELHIDEEKNILKIQDIIAVDNSPSILKSIYHTLHHRYKVHTLQNPDNLVKSLENIKPDLLLLDYNTPGTNGLELARAIRDIPEFKHTPIIFLTSEKSPDGINEAMNIGYSDFIVKPFSPRNLRDKVTKHIDKKR